jgi:hypothetical protein
METKLNEAVIGKYCIVHGETTVTAFIELTKNAYNGSVIRHLEEAYG